jgi:poly(A) polymerase
VCQTLAEAGHVAWLAGGCVRDLLLGTAIADYDIATDASPEQVAGLFPHTVTVGAAFGVTRVVLPAGVYDVARFRVEGSYSDGRHPDVVTPGSPAADASRRDFTINGLFLDPVAMEVVDHVGGLRDLRVQRCIRAIGEPRARFEEDLLRLLRAVRFAACTGFPLEASTREAIPSLADRLRASVAPERILGELRRMLGHPGAPVALDLLSELTLLDAVLPGVSPFDARSRAAWRDRVARQLQALARGGVLIETEGWLVGLAAIADPGAGRPPRARAARVEQIREALRPSRREIEVLAGLLRGLARWRDGPPASLAARKRALRDPFLPGVVALLDGAPAAAWRELRQAYRGVELHPEPLLRGDDLLAAGVSRGPRLGQLLAELEDAQLEGRVSDRRQALAWLEERLRPDQDLSQPPPGAYNGPG